MNILQATNQSQNSDMDCLYFPIDKVLYIGLGKHKCWCKKELFQKRQAVFVHNNKKYIYPIYQCQVCGAFVMNYKVFEKNKRTFEKYRLVKSSTNRPIKISSLLPAVICPVKRAQKIPVHVQWSVQHPYRGGDCSGK